MSPDWMTLATRGRACPRDLDVPAELTLPFDPNPDLSDPARWMENSWEETRRLDAEHLLVAIVDAPPEVLSQIPGIGMKTATKIHEGLGSTIPLIEEILEEGVSVYVEVPCILGALFTVDGDAGDTIHVLLVYPRAPAFPPFIELRSSDGYRLMGPRFHFSLG